MILYPLNAIAGNRRYSTVTAHFTIHQKEHFHLRTIRSSATGRPQRLNLFHICCFVAHWQPKGKGRKDSQIYPTNLSWSNGSCYTCPGWEFETCFTKRGSCVLTYAHTGLHWKQWCSGADRCATPHT